MINDEKINSSNTFYYRIDSCFDVENDLKLGTKSLLLKYLEVKFEDIEYNSNFCLINKELESLNDNYFSNHEIDYNLMKIKFEIECISLKNVFKMIEGKLLYENIGANTYDLSYNDLIILQLIIIKEISQRIDKEIVLTFNGDIDEELIYYLENNIYDTRIKLLVFSNNIHNAKNINNYYLMNQNNIDLSNDIDVSNLILLDLPYHADKVMLDLIIKDYISGKYDKKVIELIEIL